MTPKQRLAFIILQLNYGYSSWSQALRLAREAARGSSRPEALAAAEAVQSSLEAAGAAIGAMRSREERVLVAA